MPKLFLTDAIVRQLNCHAKKSQELYWDSPRTSDGKIKDGAIQGLGVRITSAGMKSFVHSYKFDGKRRRMVLGAVSNMNVASARFLAMSRNLKIVANEDPDADHPTISVRRYKTVGDIINGYWDERLSDRSEKYRERYVALMAYWHKSAPSKASLRGQNKKRNYRDFGTMFREKSANEIKPLDVQRFLNQFSTAGSHNSALAMVSAVFNWAIRMQLIDMRNPAEPISPKKTNKVRRDYDAEQIKLIARHIFQPTFLEVPAIVGDGARKRALALEHGRVVTQNAQMAEFCNYMGILFLTMARPREVITSEFTHFDLEKLIWHKHNTKGIKISNSPYEYTFRSVPIHKRVADIVFAQRKRWPTSQLIFPSQNNIDMPRDNFRKQLIRFKASPDIPDYFQLYDLKRIAISLMLVGQGMRREDVSHYVDHKGNLETTMIYDLGLVDPLRPISERIGELLGA